MESSTRPIWCWCFKRVNMKTTARETRLSKRGTGDREFNSRDLVFAFQQGNYVSAAVPESLFSQSHRERRRGDEIVRGDYGPLDSLFAEQA
jgi:hypothetical protein